MTARMICLKRHADSQEVPDTFESVVRKLRLRIGRDDAILRFALLSLCVQHSLFDMSYLGYDSLRLFTLLMRQLDSRQRISQCAYEDAQVAMLDQFAGAWEDFRIRNGIGHCEKLYGQLFIEKIMPLIVKYGIEMKVDHFALQPVAFSVVKECTKLQALSMDCLVHCRGANGAYHQPVSRARVMLKQPFTLTDYNLNWHMDRLECYVHATSAAAYVTALMSPHPNNVVINARMYGGVQKLFTMDNNATFFSIWVVEHMKLASTMPFSYSSMVVLPCDVACLIVGYMRACEEKKPIVSRTASSLHRSRRFK